VEITPNRRLGDVDLRELWRFRDLLLLLALRDIQLRYKQTLLGVVWAVVQPLGMMLVFNLVFGSFMKMSTGGVPYPVFVYSGVLVWSYFSSAASSSGNSLVSGSALVSKVYFPRLYLPAAPVLAGVVDLAIASALLVFLGLYYGIGLTWSLLLVPGVLATAVVLALAVGTLMAALNVVYRDVRHAFPFLLQLWFFSTPIFYSEEVVPERWRWLLSVNPMAGIVEAFRDALFGRPLDWFQVSMSLGVALALLLCAAVVFLRSVWSVTSPITHNGPLRCRSSPSKK
jgi:lipopolysaccharide transport system permease protein